MEGGKLGFNPVFTQVTNLHIIRRNVTVGTAIFDHCFITGRLTARGGRKSCTPKPMNSSTIKAFHKRMPFSKDIISFSVRTSKKKFQKTKEHMLL